MPDTDPQNNAADGLSDTERMVQEALAEAQASLTQMNEEVGAAPVALPELTRGAEGDPTSGIELLSDVELQVTVELGRTHMLVEDVLRLAEGSIVELNKLAGDPVDVYVNHRLVARGEVLVLNDQFCIRISEIVADLEASALAAAEDEHIRHEAATP